MYVSKSQEWVKKETDTCRLAPNLTNMNKITYRQAAIDSSMPGEFKKCN